MLKFKGGLSFVVAAAAALCIAAPASAQQTRTLKMQSTWPASLTLQDNFRMFAERVDKLTSGQIKIEALAAGQIVPAFEILDATHKKVIDGGHGVAYYWVGKNKTATLFSATPAGPFGMDHFDFLGWLYEGGGMDLYWEFYRDIIKLDVVAFPVGGSSPQAFGWFKRPIKNLADFKGLKCRQTGIVAEIYQKHGHADRQPAGRRNHSVRAARRDRLRRMGRRRRGSAPRSADRCSSITTRRACTRATRCSNSSSTATCGRASRRSSRKLCAPRRSTRSSAGASSGRSRMPTRSKRCATSIRCSCCARRRTS